MKKTNSQLIELIQELKVLSNKENVKLWKRVAKDLEKSTRRHSNVNVLKVNKYVRENETALIPGKVLSKGDLTKKITIAALSFSKEAKEKINKTGKAITIKELIKENPKGSKVRIIG
ncbi:MAG: 50S ribosomal protein L18e [Candidatus Nanoarchaeia archaeon]|jgi:large subunit ribosomal protein L18e|nr:50S ribosomal protein L18e [Candidatus Nanoarchaeia archaeon]|tara:strand:- start:9022 stop:9372 length:351 start_codon:yes stop_codon:yes gene_type:complete